MAKKRRKRGLNKEMRSQIKGTLLLALGVFCYVGLFYPNQVGGIGNYLNSILHFIAGEAAYILPVFIAFVGLRYILPGSRWQLGTRLIGLIIVLLLIPVFVQLQLLTGPAAPAQEHLFYESFVIGLNQQGGGIIGAAIGAALLYLLGPLGSIIVLFTIAFIAFLLIFNISIKRFLRVLSSFIAWLVINLKKLGLVIIDLLKNMILSARGKALARVRNRQELKETRGPLLPEQQEDIAGDISS
ncbi:MAG: DNA translocase FtsK 4TM domain-containing protein, partial [Bacillota bacterium]